MEKIFVDLEDKSYDILIGKDNLGVLEEYIEKYQKIILLSNTTVGALYSNSVLDILQGRGKEVCYYEVQDGEEHKSIESAFAIYDYMVENDFDRKSLVITLGGGVVCDLGGYIASTYMRGIDFIQIPTSLLAQVDASIGGKVAVNHTKAKNLIGTFYQPKLVLINTEFLHTLAPEEFKAGMGEIIKHSFLVNDGYYEYISDNAEQIMKLDSKTMIETIKRSVLIKKNVVETDETEQGRRAILNLGHTWGHALETATNYREYSHGEGVAKGMIFDILISIKLGYTDNSLLEKAYELFNKFHMDAKPIKMEINRLISLMKKDKKNSNNKIKFVLPKGMGDISLENVSEEIIAKINEEITDRTIKSVIDLGTNSCRLFTAEIEKVDGKINVIRKYEKFLEITRVGEDVDKNRYLLDSAMERTIKTLSIYSEKVKAYGSTETLVYATSATRDASNREYFINKVKDETGLSITCISGDKEANLSFNGAIESIPSEVVLIDIGGGSTEVVKGNSKEITFMKSFNVGAVRVTEKFFKNEEYSQVAVEEATKWIEEEMKEISNFSGKDFIFTGVAGTVTSHVSVAEEMGRYNSEKVHHYKLSREQIIDNIKLFYSKRLSERKKIIGLHEKRANVIIGGSLVLLSILDLLGRNEILVSEDDILDGMMAD